MRGHNICFWQEIRNIIYELSSIPPLIWSSASIQSFCGTHFLVIFALPLVVSGKFRISSFIEMFLQLFNSHDDCSICLNQPEIRETLLKVL